MHDLPLRLTGPLFVPPLSFSRFEVCTNITTEIYMRAYLTPCINDCGMYGQCKLLRTNNYLYAACECKAGETFTFFYGHTEQRFCLTEHLYKYWVDSTASSIMNLLLAIGKVCGHELITGCNFQHLQAFASIHDKIKTFREENEGAASAKNF